MVVVEKKLMNFESEIFGFDKIDFEKIKDNLSRIKWTYVLHDIIVYGVGPIGFYYLITGKAMLYTYIWVFAMFLLGGIGLGPGAHRYFSHRSFKATRIVKLFLLHCQTISGQYTALAWSKLHRVHHKYADTTKDPTNINRGFLASHFYAFFPFTPECLKAMDEVEASDLTADKDIMFQYDYYPVLFLVLGIILPSIIPYHLWGETFMIAFMVNIFRWMMNVTQNAFANSFMHMYGAKPYDKNVTAAENLFCILLTFGEGYHNFHHVFPYDYNGQEVGDFISFNLITFMLNIFKYFGWIYDCKTISPAMVERRKKRTGDGTDYLSLEESRKNPVWGFGDIDMDEEDKNELLAINGG